MEKFRCNRCGQSDFKSYKEVYTHIKSVHGVTPTEKDYTTVPDDSVPTSSQAQETPKKVAEETGSPATSQSQEKKNSETPTSQTQGTPKAKKEKKQPDSRLSELREKIKQLRGDIKQLRASKKKPVTEEVVGKIAELEGTIAGLTANSLAKNNELVAVIAARKAINVDKKACIAKLREIKKSINVRSQSIETNKKIAAIREEVRSLMNQVSDIKSKKI